MQEMQEMQVPRLGGEDPLEEGMTTRSMIVVCFEADCLRFILFGIGSTSWISRLMSFTKFEKFSAIISLSILSAPHFLFFSQQYKCYIFDVIPQVPKTLFISFQFIFSPLFILDNFCYSIFNFTDYFLCQSYLHCVVYFSCIFQL